MILSKSDYKEFSKRLQKYFMRKKFSVIFKDDYSLEVHTNTPTRETISLSNLAKICFKAEKEKWSELIEEYFEILANSKKMSKILKEREEDFDFYKEFIGVRFYHRDYFSNGIEESFLFIPLLEDVCLALILDFPDHIKNLDPKIFKNWNISEKKLFTLGITNIKSKYKFEIKKEKILNLTIYVVSTNHFFGNILLLELDNYENLVGKYGSLIAIPNRHETFIYPIENKEVEKAIECLIRINKNRYKEPGSVSRNLYWYNSNKFSLQTITYDAKNVFVKLTDDFRKLIRDIKTDSYI